MKSWRSYKLPACGLSPSLPCTFLSLTQWTGHYNKTSSLLKQEVTASDLANAEHMLGEHNEMMQQLGQMADSIVGEGRGMLEIMERITRKSIENRGSGGEPWREREGEKDGERERERKDGIECSQELTVAIQVFVVSQARPSHAPASAERERVRVKLIALVGAYSCTCSYSTYTAHTSPSLFPPYTLSCPAGSRMGPDYSAGISHVRQIVEEVDEKRNRLDQLAEAKKLRVEQFKQLYSCEKDAKQVCPMQFQLSMLAGFHSGAFVPP